MSIKIKDEFDKNTVLYVDVRGCSIEECKKVQEVFFALGYNWYNEGKSLRDINIETGYYTNALGGELNDFLLYGCHVDINLKSGVQYLSPKEFFDLVLEQDSVDMDLIIREALKGHPVKLRNGLKAYVRYKEEELDNTLVGVVLLLEGADIINWMSDGKHPLNSNLDIVGLWKESLKFKYWDFLNKDIKYIAKEANGGWWGFTTEPEKGSDFWFTDLDGVFSLFTGIGINNVFPKCNWEDSLIERPKKEGRVIMINPIELGVENSDKNIRKEKPLKFKYWDILNKDIKYIAKDSCGSWFGYDELPLKESKLWVLASSEDSYYELDGDVFEIDFPECDWEDSLIKRPE